MGQWISSERSQETLPSSQLGIRPVPPKAMDTVNMSERWTFQEIGDVISTYSGGPALVGTTAGTRPEGREFEQAVRTAWIILPRKSEGSPQPSC